MTVHSPRSDGVSKLRHSCYLDEFKILWEKQTLSNHTNKYEILILKIL